MKLLYTISLLAVGSIAAAEDKTNATSQSTTEASKGLANCHIPELRKGHVLRASCFADGAKQELVHSELDLNHCFGASLLKGELTAEPDGHFSRKCVKCKLGGEARGTGTHVGAWSLYCHCVAPKAEIQLEPTVWMNKQGLLECHGHVGKPMSL
ncbi:hypothetical protein BDV27DRAFT_148378 [Aspergillus caelatus]|uniref:Cyanovirin-N domain-containing protein n=1 Tax=Aspergillus caelatus TaxID=61420 RepID=A0A5N6ZU29_9EURO|nr:uncharacterized protein BDV27DRAFT_148378 [Aspergillus caelatus]KAE8360763.1 hypothetical protein BDV27DRAFT_148378 [Aspergillus caelatus]